MNTEIKNMQCGLRLNEFDGASEITVKAVLQGQHAISRIPYPYVQSYQGDDGLIKELNLLTSLKGANIAGRDWWLKNLNQYPWNIKSL